MRFMAGLNVEFEKTEQRKAVDKNKHYKNNLKETPEIPKIQTTFDMGRQHRSFRRLPKIHSLAS